MLCLDDDSFMHQRLRTTLAALRIEDVRFALGSEEALEMMQLRLPDLLIIELALSAENGAAFIQWLRRDDDSPDQYLPIIALSAYAERIRVAAARDAGATEILAKPVSAPRLRDCLVEMTENARPFIKAAGYVGPDRRRRARTFEGENRRAGEG